MPNDNMTNKRLTEHYIMDLKKPEITKWERATIVKQYLDDNNMSIRGFGIKFNIPKSTIEDWLLYRNVTQKQYNNMIRKGYGHKQIYKLLRENKGTEFKDIVTTTPFDYEVKRLSLKIGKQCTTQSEVSKQTPDLLDHLIKESNRLLMKIERKIK